MKQGRVCTSVVKGVNGKSERFYGEIVRKDEVEDFDNLVSCGLIDRVSEIRDDLELGLSVEAVEESFDFHEQIKEFVEIAVSEMKNDLKQEILEELRLELSVADEDSTGLDINNDDELTVQDIIDANSSDEIRTQIDGYGEGLYKTSTSKAELASILLELKSKD